MNHLRFHIVKKNPHFTRYEREHLNKKPNNTESHNNQKVQSILSDFPLNNLLNSFFIHNKPKQTTNRNNHIPIRQDRQTILLCKLFSDDINLLIAIKTFLSTNWTANKKKHSIYIHTHYKNYKLINKRVPKIPKMLTKMCAMCCVHCVNMNSYTHTQNGMEMKLSRGEFIYINKKITIKFQNQCKNCNWWTKTNKQTISKFKNHFAQTN